MSEPNVGRERELPNLGGGTTEPEPDESNLTGEPDPGAAHPQPTVPNEDPPGPDFIKPIPDSIDSADFVRPVHGAAISRDRIHGQQDVDPTNDATADVDADAENELPRPEQGKDYHSRR